VNHIVEQYTWNCIRSLMLSLDPDRSGWAIDAGVGHFDFYCEWMKQLGYRTLAIDAVLFPEAIDACKRGGIPLIEAALSDRDGIATLFHAPERDLRSLETMWGGMEAAQAVNSITLQSLINKYQIEGVTVLKLDIEGGEPAVIGTLESLPAAHLPLIISFEWGGEWPVKTERGAWQPSQRQRVDASFNLLHALGYERGLLVGSGDGTFMRPIESGTKPHYFEPDDNWGNAILTRGDVSTSALIEFALTGEKTNG
jgi:FkbM family methyltransferase